MHPCPWYSFCPPTKHAFDRTCSSLTSTYSTYIKTSRKLLVSRRISNAHQQRRLYPIDELIYAHIYIEYMRFLNETRSDISSLAGRLASNCAYPRPRELLYAGFQYDVKYVILLLCCYYFRFLVV